MNQRRRTRVQSRKQATVATSAGTYRGEVVNVSLKGCLVEVTGEGRPPVGAEVELVIHLEPGDAALDVTARGRVARQAGPGVGIDFLEVPPDSFPHLFRLVQYNAPDPDGIEEELASSAFEEAGS